MNSPRIKTTDITVERNINATPSEIFDIWLDCKSPGSPWFGTTKAIVNPKVDGLFYHSVYFEGQNWAHYGRFIHLERGMELQHTWVSEATMGFETIVTITFVFEGSTTMVKLHQSNVPDNEMGRRHREGWGFVLDAIAERFAKR